jgi:hypothetical protein
MNDASVCFGGIPCFCGFITAGYWFGVMRGYWATMAVWVGRFWVIMEEGVLELGLNYTAGMDTYFMDELDLRM